MNCCLGDRKSPDQQNMLRIEYLKVLLKLDKKDEVFKEAEKLVTSLNHSVSRYFCKKSVGMSQMLFFGDVLNAMNGKLLTLGGRFNNEDYLFSGFNSNVLGRVETKSICKKCFVRF